MNPRNFSGWSCYLSFNKKIKFINGLIFLNYFSICSEILFLEAENELSEAIGTKFLH